MIATRSSVVCLLFLTGCSPSSRSGAERGETPQVTEYLGLKTPEAGEGFQLRTTGADIGPGEDLEFCEVLELPGAPGDVYYLRSVEVANGEGSHHLILNAVRPGTAAEPKIADAELGKPVDCIGATQLFGEDGFDNVAVSQQPYFREDLPAGVGRVVHGGQRIVFDYHYYNTGEETVKARSAANLYLMPEAEVEHEALVFSFNNSSIDTPPLSEKTFTGECRFQDDVTIASLMRHTHQWGRDFIVRYAGGAKDGQEIFRTPDYEQGITHLFDEPITVKKGEGFRFDCAFENTENRPLRFGPNATDEMCILFGIWWGEGNSSPESQDCVMTATGDDGVSRPPSDIGFRKPTAEENAACVNLGTTAPRPLTDECAACYCDNCAVPINDCAADPECKALMDCAIETRCGYDTCIGSCPEAINAHSAGVGLLIPVGKCLEGPCGHCTE
jgi:hypothetical protein